MAKKTYYVIVTRDRVAGVVTSNWSVQFGDYDKECVQDEVIDTYGEYVRTKDCKVLKTTDDQASIDATVNALNERG